MRPRRFRGGRGEEEERQAPWWSRVVSRPSAAHTAVKMPQAARVPEDRWTMTVRDRPLHPPVAGQKCLSGR